jgi:hypothetical protein
MKSVPILILMVVLGILISCNNDSSKGCTNSNACNYDASVGEDDGSCTYICLTDAQKKRVEEFTSKAVAYIDDFGTAAAYAAFNAPNPLPTFEDEELYVFVIDISDVSNENAIMVSHGFKDELIGQNQYNMQDENGKYIVRDFIELTKNSDRSWSWYNWEDPTDNKVKKKFSYLIKYGTLIVGAGTYLN